MNVTITSSADITGSATGSMKVCGLVLPVKHYYVSMSLKEVELGLVR